MQRASRFLTSTQKKKKKVLKLKDEKHYLFGPHRQRGYFVRWSRNLRQQIAVLQLFLIKERGIIIFFEERDI